MKKTKTQFWLFFNVFLTIILSISVFSVPLGRDQGIFAYVADGILKGLSPYKCSFDIKPPFVYFVYAFSFLLFGKSSQSVYLIDLIYRLLTLFAVHLTGRKLYGEKTGLTASLLYGVFSSIIFNRIWRSAQTETFMVLPLALAFYFFADELTESVTNISKGGENKTPILVGIFSGIAFTVKYSAVFVIIPFPLFWILRKKIKKTTMFIFGFIVSLLPFFLYFYYHNSLSELYISTVQFNVFHVSRRFYAKPFLNAFLRYGRKIWREMHFLIIFSALFLFSDKDRFYKPLIIWTSASFLSIVVQGKFWFYHWMILLGPLSIMSGRQIVLLYEKYVNKSAKVVMTLFFSGMFLLSLKSNHIRYRVSENMKYLRGELSRKEFLLPFDRLSNNVSFSNGENMAEYIKKRTNVNDSIWIFGHESLVYFLANRLSSTRFQWDYPLTIDIPEAEQIKKIFLKTCLKEINENKPEIIFIMVKDTNPIEKEDSIIQWMCVSELVVFLFQDYDFVEKKYNSFIYRRKK